MTGIDDTHDDDDHGHSMMRRPFPCRRLVLLTFAVISSACQTPTSKSTATPTAPAGPPPFAFSHQPSTATLHLVHLGDTEAGMLGDDRGLGGVARAAAVVDALTRRAGTALVVHAGDTMIPAPELALQMPWPADARERRSPLLVANDALGLHVAVLGNHDFDLGEGFLTDVIKRAAFPFIASTLAVPGGPLAAVVDNETRWLGVPTSAGRLLRRAKMCLGTLTVDHCDGTVIGVVGAVPESLRILSGGAVSAQAPADVDATIAALKPHVEALHADGVRMVVLLSHRQGIQRDMDMVARGLTGVDVIVSGGGENRLVVPGHRTLPDEPIDALCTSEPLGCYPVWRMAPDGAPVALVATDGGLQTVGALDVTFDDGGHITGIEKSSRPWIIDEESLLELRADVHRDLVALELATRDALAPLMEVVGHVDVFLEGTRELVRNEETNLGSLSADALLAAARVEQPTTMAAFRNGGAVRDSIGVIAKGGARLGKDITILDVKSALRFDSAVVVVKLSHAELARAVEATLIGAGTGQGRFPQVSAGVQLRFDPNGRDQVQTRVDGRVSGVASDGSRLRDLAITGPDGVVTVVVRDGAVVAPTAVVTIATIDYLAKGGDGWFPGIPVVATPVTSSEQKAFMDFLRVPEAVTASLAVSGRISTTTGPATSVPVSR